MRLLTSKWMLLTGLAVVTLGCQGTRAEVAPAELDGRTSIEIMTARRGVVREVGNYYGRVQERRSIRVSAEIGGIAFTVPLEKGDTVRAGDLLLRVDEEPFRLAEEQASQNLAAALLRIDQEEQTIALEEAQIDAGLKQAQAAVDMARAQLALVEAGARSEEKKQLKAVVDGAEAGMENAKIQLDRVKSLVAAGAGTKQQLDTTEAAFKTASAGYNQAVQGYRLVRKGARDESKDAARAALRQAEAGFEGARASLESLAIREKELEATFIQVAQAEIALETARLQRSKTVVKAPLEPGQEALIQMRNIDEGEMVAPGIPLFELLILDRPRLVFDVSGKDVGYFEEGQTMAARCHGDHTPERKGTLVLIDARANPQNATFPIELEMDNGDRGLRMGMICEVMAELTLRPGVLVPRDAILDTQDGKTVLVEEDGVVRQKNVTIAGVQEGIAAVSAGLEEGERVVVVGTRLASDGDEVVVRGERASVLKVGDKIYEHQQ
jgi:RND family efflux transporter MFP subunit